MENHQPVVSVILPTYNRPTLLERAIKSVFNQTFQDFEVIVVNDDGIDVTHIINKFNGSDKIIYLQHTTNKGLAATRNTGLIAARGNYITYLDDDDFYYANHLETLVHALYSSDYRVAYTDACRAWVKEENGQVLVEKKDIPWSQDFNADLLMELNYIPVLCIMHDRKLLDEVGLFDDSLEALEDYDLWIRMSRKVPFIHISQTTAEYSWRSDGETITSKFNFDFSASRTKIFEKYREERKELERLGRIKTPESKVIELQRQVNELLESLAWHQKEIGNLQDSQALIIENNRITNGQYTQQIEELNLQIKTLGTELVDKEREIAWLDARSTGSRQEVERLNALLNEIYGSRGWKMIKFIWTAHLKLSPPKSPQERLLRKIYQAILMRKQKLSDQSISSSPVISSNQAVPEAVLPVKNEIAEEVNIFREALLAIDEYIPTIGLSPMVSIVIPVYNCLNYTKQCLYTIYEDSPRTSFEVVVVNNASVDETAEWLKFFAGTHSNFRFINNQENLGFGKAVNQGAEIARGKYICIANNDLLMAPGWLDKLADAMAADNSLGIVSPMTNYIGEGAQLDQDAVNVTPEQVKDYGNRRARLDLPVQITPDRLVFFCVMIRHDLYDLLGGLSDVYGKGNFEDDDFSMRTRLAGLRLGIVPTAFVFHYGSRTFKEQKISHNEWFERNRGLFYERVANFSTRFPQVSVLNKPSNICVSVILRTQNRPILLRNALLSLANQTYRDFEVVLVNDGGPDIPQLLEEFSPYLKICYIHHETQLGRCRALNTGLENSQSDWITYLDDDDIVYPTHLELLVTPMLENPEIEVTYSNSNKALCINHGGPDIVISRLPMPIFEFNRDALLIQNYIPIMAFMHKRSLVKEIGNFDETIDVLEDWDFLMRLATRTNFYHVSRISNEYRFRAGDKLYNSITRDRQKAIETIKMLYSRYPISTPTGAEERDDVLCRMAEQVKQLHMIQQLDYSGLQKNLLTISETSGFQLQYFRQGGFRA